MKKVIITLFAVLVCLLQVHATGITSTNITTDEQACKLQSGARGILNTIEYLSGSTTRSTVSGESRINSDTTIWKGHFLKNGTSIYFIQITATGGFFFDMDANNITKGGFSQKVSNISLYKYSCTRKTTTLVSKENLKRLGDMKSIQIDWIKGGYLQFNTTSPSYLTQGHILSENTGKILDFTQYKGYKKEWKNIAYSYSNLGKIKLIDTVYNGGSSFYNRIYIIDIPKKEIRYLYRTADDYYVYPTN